MDIKFCLISLLSLLLHDPTECVLNQIVTELRKKGKISLTDIRSYLDKENHQWDTALILIALIDPSIEKLQILLKGASALFSTPLLLNTEERSAIVKAYQKSNIKHLLSTPNCIQSTLVKARGAFLNSCLENLTEIFENNKGVYFTWARKGVSFSNRIASGLQDIRDECFQDSFIQVKQRFSRILPETYRAYLTRVMKNNLLNPPIPQPPGEIVSLDETDEDGKQIYELEADPIYDPERRSLELDGLNTIRSSIKKLGDTILQGRNGKPLTAAQIRRATRQVYLIFHLLGSLSDSDSDSDSERETYQGIADKFTVTVECINKDLAYIRRFIDTQCHLGIYR